MTKAWHFQSDAGRPIATMITELIARFPGYAGPIAAYWPRWLETIPGPMPGMLDLVAELAAAKVPQFAITNFGAEFWAMFRPTAPVFDRFRDIVVSGVEKVAKPDPAIYALALARFDLGPGEGVFIDDRADNIAAADTAGLIGHVFAGVADTRAWLAAQGILPA
ncbi:MAG: HAD-IA family hydrolase [Janthinobacterium lividum]